MTGSLLSLLAWGIRVWKEVNLEMSILAFFLEKILFKYGVTKTSELKIQQNIVSLYYYSYADSCYCSILHFHNCKKCRSFYIYRVWIGPVTIWYIYMASHNIAHCLLQTSCLCNHCSYWCILGFPVGTVSLYHYLCIPCHEVSSEVEDLSKLSYAMNTDSKGSVYLTPDFPLSINWLQSVSQSEQWL